MTTPPPRPALRRAADADVSPAAPRQSAAPEKPPRQDTAGSERTSGAADKGKAPKGSKESKGAKGTKGSKESKGSKKQRKKKRTAQGGRSEPDTIVVSFTLSQRDLARLDDRADELGHSRERTLTLLVQAWLDS